MEGFKRSKFNRILKIIAEKEGISVEEVYREMQAAIDAGYSNPDPAIRTAWEKVPLPYGKPRPEDMVVYCAGQIKA